ncbi:hypothetical protein IC762_19120 [Bradyrhizobium genosp. L]|uniref:hypothetical protein n=1 Tax=Bradyrhizobium genosp. L TaxID=83637 RepID=UPI0018A24A0C|nr:hypothetical protein [Bradyrhizobium genosp. L]QPF81910.1 hypothetical protein IC762_19120 [Bradyrhizobium genosp. L]
MKRFLIIVLLTVCPVAAQTAQPSPTPPTDRERVQADRAKAAADEKTAPSARPWDRDANGKRPWERATPAK